MGDQRVLVPIDFSDDSLSAYQMALDHFAGVDKTLVLLHVVEHRSHDVGQNHLLSAEELDNVRRNLQTLGNSRRGAWKEVEVLIESGKPTDAIIATVKQENIDLVIMGSHGTSSLTRALFGSTTYDVARKVKCSVLINKRQ